MDRYATLREGLVGAWCPSLRTGGYTLEDRSNRRNNGTLVNAPTLSAGALNLASASSQYVSVLSAAATTALTQGEFSISAWVRPVSVSGTMVIAGSLTSGGVGCSFNFELGRAASKLTWLQNGSSVDATSSATLTANVWQFVWATRSGTTGAWNVTLGVGNQYNSTSTAVNPNTVTIRSTSIGRGGDFNGIYYNGLIDDVRAWSRCLTTSEMLLVGKARGAGLLPTRHRRANALGSQFWLRDAGTWKKATGWIKVNGVWTKATPKIRVSGAYK